MTYSLEVGEKLAKKFEKLRKKDRLQAEILKRKISEILENPHHFKPLAGSMSGTRRTHIRNFVLTFEIIESENKVRLLDYDHHDNIYEK